MDTDNDEIQMSLFDEPKEDKCSEEHGEKKLTLIKPKGSKKTVKESEDKDKYRLKCFKSELKDVEFLTEEELFSGFDSIRIITFSYSLSFLDRIVTRFKYAEVIIGAQFIVMKHGRMQDLLVDGLANSKYLQNNLYRYPGLVSMMKEGNLVLRVPEIAIDHRKMYLLKADSGRTRVIYSSANASNPGWSGDQKEHIDYDDTIMGYEKAQEEFETSWELSKNLPLEALSMSKSGSEKEELVESNVIIKGAKEIGKLTLLEGSGDTREVMERAEYVVEFENYGKNYKAIMADEFTKPKNGVYELLPKSIEKLKINNKKLLERRKMEFRTVKKSYPSMKIDFDSKAVYMDDNPIDLNPEAADVIKDLEQLVTVFNNYNGFLDHNGQLQFTHYKLINAMFLSPFIAHIRCVANARNIGTSALPLFLLLYSEGSNCGKTFMARLILKMMTGKNLNPILKVNCKKEKFVNLMDFYGTPIFVDEIDNKWFANVRDVIKNAERCEQELREYQPMIAMASNDVVDPDLPIRKRLVYLKYDAALPSKTDASAQESSGKAIINRMGNAFYREYLRRMILKVNDIVDYIYDAKDIPDGWYPDVFKISSEVILSIFEDFSIEKVPCFRELTWNKDFALSAGSEAVEEIRRLYDTSRKNFIIKDDIIIIELGSDTTSKRRLEAIANTLPSEVNAKLTPGRDSCTLRMDRKPLEALLGFKFRRFLFF